MGKLCELALVSLALLALLHTDSTWAKRSGSSSSSSKKTASSNRGSDKKPPKTSNTQTGSYPRQPQSPNRNPNPYPAGGSYPGRGTNQNQNPAGGYPAAGGYPNQQYPGRANPGGYPNQNPAAGGYPAAGGNPAAGGYPNQQYPGRANPGGYPNQNPAAGGYPAAGGNPVAGGYPNQQYPGRANPGGYPNQNPAAGGYPNQNPGRGGVNPGYPAGGHPAGGYPVRGGNTGWGQAGGYPGGGTGGGYQPNWNPNNKILSPRYGGGYGYGGMGGGSPFSRSVQGMGQYPSTQSKGFAKKAFMAAGVGALAGMAVGYGLGRFPRPHFNFRNPQEEQSYNNYMYSKYGERSTDENDYGRDYTYKVPPRAESYDSFMDTCMKRNDLLQDQGRDSQATPNNQKNNPQGANSQNMPITPEMGNSSPASNQEGTDKVKPLTPAPDEIAGEGKEEVDGPTVSIEEIGYPALVEQLKNRKCVELYINHSERFLEKQTAERSSSSSNNNNNNKNVNSRSNPLGQGLVQLITSLLMVLSSILLLH
ncbi:prion protein b isoform X2 [Salmo salar]|uniref:Prion protein b isoform X2 n=1 Tax=Salmo salar TaxID=8030 RepID=A0ABM3CDW6_SALSA|nr:prion protein b isoform X2 [Salmo salar]